MLRKIAVPTLFTALGAGLSLAALNCSPKPAIETQKQASIVERVLLPQPAFAAGGNGVQIADIAERVVSGVVNISTEKVVKNTRGRGGPFNDPFFRQFFGDRFRQMPQERREQSLGSGVIVEESGLILTNNHVIEGASDVRVTLSDGREVEAEIVGTDPETDVGVLKLKEKVEGLSPLGFGDADSLRLGDIVLAVGNPFGVGQTVTMGIVSATGRANVGIVDYEDFIQTDAAINPGNSGGALVNTRGELVGINTAILSRSGGYQGIGFAIPSNMAKRIMRSLVDDGRVNRGWLGIAIQNVDRNLAEAMGLEVNSGVLVSDVNAGSPAEEGGVERGDVIVAVNGEAVKSTGELRNSIAIAGADTDVKLKVLRDGKEKTLTVKLGAKPGSEAAVSSNRGKDGGDDGMESLGLRVAPLNDETRARYRLDESISSGLVVVDVQRGSRAARAGLRPGDVIREIARKQVKSIDELRSAVKGLTGAAPILVQRGPNTIYLALPKAE